MQVPGSDWVEFSNALAAETDVVLAVELAYKISPQVPGQSLEMNPYA